MIFRAGESAMVTSRFRLIRMATHRYAHLVAARQAPVTSGLCKQHTHRKQAVGLYSKAKFISTQRNRLISFLFIQGYGLRSSKGLVKTRAYAAFPARGFSMPTRLIRKTTVGNGARICPLIPAMFGSANLKSILCAIR